MFFELVYGIVSNGAWLLSLFIFFTLISRNKRFSHIIKNIVSGPLIGLIGIILMTNPYVYAPGIIFDTRTILLAITGMFIGTIPAIIAGVMLMIFRLYQGVFGGVDVGMWMGVGSIVSSTVIGILWRHFRLPVIVFSKPLQTISEIYLVGILVHVTMLSMILLLPATARLEVFLDIALPVLLIYPVIMMTLGYFLLYEREEMKRYEGSRQNEAMFRSLFESAATMHLLVNPRTLKVTYINQKAMLFYGFNDQDVKDLSFYRISTMTKPRIDEEVILFSTSKKDFLTDYHHTLSGDKRVEVYGINVQFSNDNYLLLTVFDITKQVEAIEDQASIKAQLDLEQQRLSRIVDSAADIIFEIDLNKRFVSVFGKGLNKLNIQIENVIGQDVLQVFGHGAKTRHEAYDKALEGFFQHYEWHHEADGNIYHFNTHLAPIFNENKRVIGAVGICRDISDIKERQKEIEYMSYHDQLTGIYNRRYFAEELAELDHELYYPLGVVMMDLTGLKIINDAYGHQAGDEALIQTAKALQSHCPKEGFVARIGGDEFVLISPNTTDQALHDDVQQFIIAIEDVYIMDIKLSVSIGYEIKKDDTLPIKEVLKAAENKMYRNKLIHGRSARSAAIKAILTTLTSKYSEEKVHAERVSKFCFQMGKALGLPKDDLTELELAGLYHDIGKISLPDAIIKKAGPLSVEEYGIIKKHPEISYQILRTADEYSDIAKHALYHHERMDGNGYPEGIKDKDIPLFSRIISIVDAYEIMTSNRPYRKATSKQEAIKELKAHAGTQFDANLVDTFIQVLMNVA